MDKEELDKIIPGYTYSPRDYINCMMCKHRIRTVDPGVMKAWYNDLDCRLIKDADLDFRIKLDHICKKFEPLDL